MDARYEMFENIGMHLLNDKKPSVFLNSVSDNPIFREYPFSMLLKMKQTKQSPKHHPEGNVWVHTMMVLDHAAFYKDRSTESEAFMWAALLHDIGKPETTKVIKGRITSYDHDKAGCSLVMEFLSVFGTEDDFNKRVAALVRWHMQILFVVKNLPFADISAMKSEADIHDVALLGLCDRLGRKDADYEEERANISLFLKKCGASEKWI